MKKILFLIFFIFAQQTFAKVVELYDGFVYNELKSRISKNPNQDNKPNEIFQQLEFKLRLNIIEEIQGYALFKTEYCQFHWKKDERRLFINSFGLKFFLNPIAYFTLGSLYVDLNPYILKSYPWITDIFRGASFTFEKAFFKFYSFIANNSQNPDESNWEAIYNNYGLDYDYSTINLGNNNENPSLWWGLKLFHQSERKYFLTYNFTIIYLHENYQLNDNLYNKSSIFNNDIIGLETTLKFFDYINLNFFLSPMRKYIKNYSFISNTTTGAKTFNYENKEIKKCGAYKTEIYCEDILGNIFNQYDTSFYFKYENVDMLYRPIYMDSHLENRTIEFEANVFNGRRGYFTKIEQFLGWGLKVGFGYQVYNYDYKFRNENVYNFYGLGKNPTIFEKQIRISEKISKKFRLQFIYQIREIKDGLFAHNDDKLNSFFIRIESDPIDNMFVAIEYAYNNNYLKNFNELLVKLMVWGL
jgi:hypothetical protein